MTVTPYDLGRVYVEQGLRKLRSLWSRILDNSKFVRQINLKTTIRQAGLEAQLGLDKLDKCLIHNQSLGIRQIYKWQKNIAIQISLAKNKAERKMLSLFFFLKLSFWHVQH